MVKASHVLDRVLVLEMVRVTEAAAVAASKLIGRGDEKAADHAVSFPLTRLLPGSNRPTSSGYGPFVLVCSPGF